MTYDPMTDVAEFHDKFNRDGKGRRSRPISISLIGKRISLITEEYLEVKHALELVAFTIQNDSHYDDKVYEYEHLAKELADLLYMVYGTAEELGIPLQEVFKAIHESNMSKVWDDGEVHYNEIGKILKPPTHTPPDLGPILDAAIQQRFRI